MRCQSHALFHPHANPCILCDDIAKRNHQLECEIGLLSAGLQHANLRDRKQGHNARPEVGEVQVTPKKVFQFENASKNRWRPFFGVCRGKSQCQPLSGRVRCTNAISSSLARCTKCRYRPHAKVWLRVPLTSDTHQHKHEPLNPLTLQQNIIPKLLVYPLPGVETKRMNWFAGSSEKQTRSVFCCVNFVATKLHN